jgi:hypothetical protein
MSIRSFARLAVRYAAPAAVQMMKRVCRVRAQCPLWTTGAHSGDSHALSAPHSMPSPLARLAISLLFSRRLPGCSLSTRAEAKSALVREPGGVCADSTRHMWACHRCDASAVPPLPRCLVPEATECARVDPPSITGGA